MMTRPSGTDRARTVIVLTIETAFVLSILCVIAVGLWALL